MTFVLTRKVESQVPKTNSYFYKPDYTFYQPSQFSLYNEENKTESKPNSFTQTQKHQKLNNSSDCSKNFGQKVNLEKKQKPKVQTTQKNETKEHIKEIPSNGKAVIAKICKKKKNLEVKQKK